MKTRIELTEESDHGNPKSRVYRAVLSAFFYGFMSVSTVFLNKAIFKVHRFKFPATLVVGQMAFTLLLVAAMQHVGIVRKFSFSTVHFKKVGGLSFFFVLKLLLDMSALSVVNIPMYGVLKSSTTPCVLLLDYLLRNKSASRRVQIAVLVITLGGFIAGYGDLTFDLVGYILAISSALSTAAYVVMVGKLGDDMHMDSWMLLFYNCLWSLPLSVLLMLAKGELASLWNYHSVHTTPFIVCFAASCASAFVLNWATYMCTLENDSLTTSVVGRTKSIVQTLGGLFAFGDVQISAMNLSGVGINSLGVMWYALEKFLEHKAREAKIHQSVLMDQAEQGNRIEKAGSSGESKLVVSMKSPRGNVHVR
mmetsp:Transcript_25275/g.47800  ORF Transcript_25275/g.47800 Transcript_25275/m.47800 type:complete len:364 (-) Transcript_25275:234-1325(-)